MLLMLFYVSCTLTAYVIFLLRLHVSDLVWKIYVYFFLSTFVFVCVFVCRCVITLS